MADKVSLYRFSATNASLGILALDKMPSPAEAKGQLKTPERNGTAL
jgi:hypothetical protein